MKRLAVLGAIVALAVPAATAYATPPVGATGSVLGRGPNQVTDALNHTAGREVVTQQITFAPGTTTGWHTHHGEVVVVVVSGTLSLWRTPGTAEHPNCTKMDVGPGESWVAPGSGTEWDLARNETTADVVLQVTYVNVPAGAPLLTHATTNPCPGTPDEFATSPTGVVGVIHGRATLPAANVAVPAGPEFVIQRVEIAPGGEAGWHSHPGHTFVLVTGSGVTFVHGDCTTTAVPAGTGFVDQPNVVHNVRNTGTATAVLFATYTNVPAGGAFRIDANAPACAAATPAPVLPNTAANDIVGVGEQSTMPTLVLISLAGMAGATALAARRVRR